MNKEAWFLPDDDSDVDSLQTNVVIWVVQVLDQNWSSYESSGLDTGSVPSVNIKSQCSQILRPTLLTIFDFK